MEFIVTNTLPFDSTVNISNLIGRKLVSSKGFVVGKINEVKINALNMKIEGVVVKRGFFRKIYIDKNYIEKISSNSIILSIEPSIFLKGKKVITSEGKVLGGVGEINRIKETNDVESFIVKPFFRKAFVVPFSAVQMMGKSIMLKKSYGENRA